jgi:hypothetical protein
MSFRIENQDKNQEAKKRIEVMIKLLNFLKNQKRKRQLKLKVKKQDKIVVLFFPSVKRRTKTYQRHRILSR